MDYTTLSLADVRAGLESVARETQTTFGHLTARQLNWRPAATRWSVAQCFDHLLQANDQMFKAADDALRNDAGRSSWQRLPLLPRLLGRALVRSQAPETSRKFVAPRRAAPAASHIAADVLERFIAQQRDAAWRLQTLDEGDAARTFMTSPFISVVVYSVLDGWRLVLAHDRRHFQQALRVTHSGEFPHTL